MAAKGTKLFKIASQINIGRDAIVEYLVSKGFEVTNKATSVLSDEMVDLVIEKFAKELKVAEKQREKVKRQAAVRKTLMESGSTVTIEDVGEEIPDMATLVAEEQAAAAPETPAAPQAEAPEAEAPVVEAPAAPEPPSAEAVEEPIAEEKGPKVGQVIDLSSVGKPPEPPPVPEPAPEPEPTVAAAKPAAPSTIRAAITRAAARKSPTATPSWTSLPLPCRPPAKCRATRTTKNIPNMPTPTRPVTLSKASSKKSSPPGTQEDRRSFVCGLLAFSGVLEFRSHVPQLVGY